MTKLPVALRCSLPLDILVVDRADRVPAAN
jgi:hypothetical protein